jgi:hypothetical protein
VSPGAGRRQHRVHAQRERRLPEVAVDQALGAQHLDHLHAQRPAVAGAGRVADRRVFGPQAQDGRAVARRGGGQRQRRPLDQEAAALGRAAQQVHRRRADETGDEGAGRRRVDLFRRADLLDLAGVHHQHAFGQRHRLDLVVGDEQRGDAELAVQGLDLQPRLRAQLGVEVGQRLVEQEDLGLAHDRAAHRDALALAAGELTRLAVQQRTELEDLGRLLHPLFDLRLGQLGDLQAVGHVVVHAHVRVQGVVLEHHRDVALGRFEPVDDPPADRDLAAADLLQPGDHAQQRALAAARRADDDDELAVVDLGVDAMDDLDGLRAVAVGLLDLSQRNRTHGVLVVRCGAARRRRAISRCRPGP